MASNPTVTAATDEQLQAELNARAAARAAAERQAAVDAAAPFAACGFGTGQPIGLTMPELIAALETAKNGSGGNNHTYATSAVMGLKGLDDTVGRMLAAASAEPAPAPEGGATGDGQ